MKLKCRTPGCTNVAKYRNRRCRKCRAEKARPCVQCGKVGPVGVQNELCRKCYEIRHKEDRVATPHGANMIESPGPCSRCGTPQTWRARLNLMCDECLAESLERAYLGGESERRAFRVHRGEGVEDRGIRTSGD